MMTTYIRKVVSRPFSAVLRSAQAGSMDGGSYADIVFIPYLVGVLVVGIFFALIGFWRVGASLATQMSAQVGSVAPGEGDSTLSGAWAIWTNTAGPGTGFSVNSDDRTVSAELNTGQTLDYVGFGPWVMTIDGQTSSRSERFYPGGPVCNGTECGE